MSIASHYELIVVFNWHCLFGGVKYIIWSRKNIQVWSKKRHRNNYLHGSHIEMSYGRWDMIEETGHLSARDYLPPVRSECERVQLPARHAMAGCQSHKSG